MPTIRLPYPHRGQRTVWDQMRRITVRQQARRFNWLAAGRRWRKTTLGVSIAVEEALGKGLSLVWGAPTFDQVRIAWNEMRHGCAGAVTFTQQRMMAEFPSGGRVIFRSLDDPDNARGHTADGVIIDEAEAVKPSAWYEVLRPMLIDTGGWLWAMGTPLGRNWFFQEHVLAADREDSVAWQIPTVGCEVVDDGRRLERKPHPLENPEIPYAEIETMFKTLPLRTFRQEILAEFVEGEGAVFRNITANLYEGPAVAAEHRDHTVVAGVDWGQVADFTAVSIACRDCMRELYLDRFHGIDYRLQRERIKALFERWGVGYALVELNSIGQPNFEDLVYDGVPVAGFETTASSKPPLIESLALSLEKEEVKWLADRVGTAELEAYERKVNANTGRPTYSAPEGMNDDSVMARALCRKAIDDGGPWAYIL